jgi:hypothetical protein
MAIGWQALLTLTLMLVTTVIAMQLFAESWLGTWPKSAPSSDGLSPSTSSPAASEPSSQQEAAQTS